MINLSELTIEQKIRLYKELKLRSLKKLLKSNPNVHLKDIEKKINQKIELIESNFKQTTLKQPKIIKGEVGPRGLPGKDGKNGKDGVNGKNGSPDTPQEIVNKLESLVGDNRLSAKAIKDLNKYIKQAQQLTVVGGGGIGRNTVNTIVEQSSINDRLFTLIMS